MSQYVIFIDPYKSTFLPAKKSFLGHTLPYSEDAILKIAVDPLSIRARSNGRYYKTTEEAKNSLDNNKYLTPIFEIDESTTPPRIISAQHAGITYDLSTVWQDQQVLSEEMKRLIERDTQKRIEDPISKIRVEFLFLEGKVPYSELARICKETNQLLDNPSPENIEQYKTLAQSQEKTSPFHALAVLMIALAVALAALSVALFINPVAAGYYTPAIRAGLYSTFFGAAGAFTLFGEKQAREMSLSGAMTSLADYQQPFSKL